MWPYDKTADPPIPAVPIIIHHPVLPNQSQEVIARLDSAADVSAIPQNTAVQLQLLPNRTIVTEAYDGSQATTRTYVVTIQVAQARFIELEVILIPEPYVLLGREVLNHFYAHLKGTELLLELRLKL